MTGASGVLGSELARYFTRSSGYRIHAVSRRPCPTLPACDPAQKIVKTIFDAQWLAAADTDATIAHCAGLSNPRQEFRNFSVLAREHILPHVEMIEALLSRGWRGRLIFFSSGGTIYGNAIEVPIAETHPTNPVSQYGLHKLCLERALIQLAQERGFEVIILRVSNPYGSMLSKPNQGVIPILINAFLNDHEFKIIGDGTAERDYIEMEDFVSAVEHCVTVEMKTPTLVLNIGSGQSTSLNDLIQVFCGHFGRALKTTYTAAHSDVQSNVLLCDRAHEVLGWRARVSLETGLKRMLERADVHNKRS